MVLDRLGRPHRFLLAMAAAFPSVQVADVLASLGIVSVAMGFAFKDRTFDGRRVHSGP